ncbi:MAG: hypothetical protein GC152_01535 [Alphaproteobacteria bacterium]|nr:hypothetical protein [Alphaproteobacteria bacterium]
MDEREFDELAADLPGLARVGKFVRSLGGIPWFANLGEELTPGAHAAARAFADGLGFPYAEVAVLPEWEDAAAAAENLDWNTPGWDAEESLRADVTVRAAEVLSEDALRFAIAASADIVSTAAKTAIQEAASLSDLADDAMKDLAVGAAVQAAHEALLAIVATGESDDEPHVFLAKFQLFEFGRWPIGIAGQTLNLF